MSDDETGSGRASRRTQFEHAMGYGLPVLLLLACLAIIAPFIPALVWSAVIVVTLWRPLEWLTARLGGRRGLVATLLALAMLGLVVGPVVSLADNIASGIPQLRRMGTELIAAVPRDPPDLLLLYFA